MTYLLPSHDSLQQAITHLTYDYTGTNSARLELIKRIQQFAHLAGTQHEVAGLLVYGLQTINAEYLLKKPKSQSWGLFSTAGSSLYEAIERGLHIDKNNKLTSHKKIIYLSALLNLIKRTDDKSFEADIKLQVKALLKLSSADLEMLKKKRPSAASLAKHFKDMPEKYHTKKEQHAGRDKFIEFITILERECIADQLDMAKSQMVASAANGDKRSIGYTVRFGAILYLMQQIEDEYTLMSPHNSYLYQLCQKALNIKVSSDIPALEKLTYYEALANQIPKVNPTQSEETSWENKGFRKGKLFFLSMQNKLNDLTSAIIKEVDRADAHPYIARVRSVVENATFFGVNICSTNLASVVMPTSLGSSVISSGAGMVGLVFFGPPAAGALLASWLAIILEKHLIPTAINRFSYKMFNGVSTLISKTTGQVVYHTLSLPIDVVSALGDLILKMPTQPLEVKPYDDMQWIESLLNLPDDVFPLEHKEIIHSLEALNASKIEAQEVNLAAASFRSVQ